MQFIVELIAPVLIWISGLAFSHVGVELSLNRHEPVVQRVVDRTTETRTGQISAECPDSSARVHAV